MNFFDSTANIYVKIILISFYTDIPPPYDEAVKIKTIDNIMNTSSQHPSSAPIHSISLSVDQADAAAIATSNNTSGEHPNRKRTAPSFLSQSP